MVVLLRRWVPLDVVAEFCAPKDTVALSWLFSVSGPKGFDQEREGGEEKVSITLASIGTMGSPEFFDVGCSTRYFFMKKYGGGHDVSMLLDKFGGWEYDGVLKNN